jgi:hypothetical protein
MDDNGQVKINEARLKKLKEFSLIKQMLINISNEKHQIDLNLLQSLILELFMKHSLYSMLIESGEAYEPRNIGEITKDCIYEFLSCQSKNIKNSLRNSEEHQK